MSKTGLAMCGLFVLVCIGLVLAYAGVFAYE